MTVDPRIIGGPPRRWWLAALILLMGCSEFIDRETPDTGGASGDASGVDAFSGLCLDKVCDDSDPCTENFCNPGTGACEFPALPDGVACDDGLFCTALDACTAGSCLGEPLECESSAGGCRVGVCDEDADACTLDTQDDGTGCEDGDLCTSMDACLSGVCQGGTPVDCPDSGDPCTQNSCNSETGACVETALANTAPCEDGDPCTMNEVCTAGVCMGEPRICPEPAGECLVAFCDPSVGCSASEAEDGAACDDGLICTESDVCTSGSCAGLEKDCSDAAGPCFLGTCSEEAGGSCVSEMLAEGADCEDGNPCTTGSFCVEGGCAGGEQKDCSGENGPCAQGLCNTSDGSCGAVPLADGLDCTDGDLCTSADSCLGGQCVGDLLDCSSLDNDCNDAICNPLTGSCQVTIDTGADGGACDDGDFCTVDGFCAEGLCVVKPRDCSGQEDVCHDAGCDSEAGACVKIDKGNGFPCDDGLVCTTIDVCSNGQCVGSGGVDCSGLDGACVVGVCSDSGGGCEAQPAADGASCDDGLACTENDECTGGTCSGAPTDCSSLDAGCQTGVCDELAGGCQPAPAADGTACEDGVACTVGDTCSAGSCSAGTPVDCPCPSPWRVADTTSGCIELPGKIYLSSAVGFTVEFWMKTDSLTPGIILDQRVSETPGESDWYIAYELAGENGQARFRYGNITGNDSTIGMSGVTLNDGVWHHLALVRKPPFVQWFVDGAPLSAFNTANATSLQNPSSLMLGCSAFGGGAFAGRLDEVRISKFARYQGPFAPPARHLDDAATTVLFRLDEAPGSAEVVDASGGAPGTVNPGVSFVADGPTGGCCGDGVVSPGESCDPAVEAGPVCGGESCELEAPLEQSVLLGGGTCIVAAAEPILNNVTSMTVEAWIKTGSSGPAWLLDKRGDPLGGDGWAWRLEADGRVSFVGYLGSGQEVSHQTALPINDGQWHHVAMVMTQTTKVRFYVDGVSSATQTLTSLVAVGTDVALHIGCDQEGNAGFVGQLDGIRITDGARYGLGFTPSPAPAPDDDTVFALTFDQPSAQVQDTGPFQIGVGPTTPLELVPDAP